MGDCSNTAAEPNKYHLYWFCAYGGYIQFHLVSLLLTIGGHVVCVCVRVFVFCIETEDRICGYEEGLTIAFMPPLTYYTF